MKKILVLLTVFMCFEIQSYSQTTSQELDIPTVRIPEDIHEDNRYFESSLGCGVIRMDKEFYSTLNIDFALYGFYFEYDSFSPEHRHDLNVGRWRDRRGSSCLLGYFIPLPFQYSKVKISPLIGYTFVAEGYTDGYDWWVTDHGLNNSFNESYRTDGVDFGVLIRLSAPMLPSSWYESTLISKDSLRATLSAKITRFSFGINLGFAVYI